MSYFQFEHRSVYYEETGAGAPLLLLHGNAASSNMFYEIAKRYEGQRRVILIDFLGHGRSDRLAALPSDLWFYEAEQVLALLREKQYGKVDIVGTSGGALAAVNVALEAPELVGRLIADSFEGEQAVRAFTENLKLDRERSKRDENARLLTAICTARTGSAWWTAIPTPFSGMSGRSARSFTGVCAHSGRKSC